ncbi:lipoprotein intramolecular transacylase Lit [Desulfoluna spongiiphila]|uniref:lipoprotein intramolecular transacylase Lit n=1 Tax=Desulfoluna spongiiphila TaxID=419481 RepID=UPI001254E7C9|nr:DUF1461 domain-containing protein [Desulfoluna spongiiphila]VVS92025.1 consensus disorder prediction [Desulfoluna spongiiphila]
MTHVRALLTGVSLFYLTFWLPLAAVVYTPVWYDASCGIHGRCGQLKAGPPDVLIRQLTAFLSHGGELAHPAWTAKERQHLAEARDRLDLAAVVAAVSLVCLAFAATPSLLKGSALVNLALFPLLTGIFPFFTTFWRDLFHPLLFSNHLWLNTPLDVSFYLMPRRFFFWTLALGIGGAVAANIVVAAVTWPMGRRGTNRITETGGNMARIGWVAVGLVAGVLLTLGARMTMDKGGAPQGAEDPVIAEERMPAPEHGQASHSVDGSRQPVPEGAEKRPPFVPDMDRMRASLTGNLALPPETEEERWQREEEKKSRNELFGRISANIASVDEVHSYYDEQALLTRDSIAMLEWILKEHEGEMGERDLAKHQFLLEQFKKRLDAIPDRQAAALKRIDEKQANG